MWSFLLLGTCQEDLVKREFLNSCVRWKPQILALLKNLPSTWPELHSSDKSYKKPRSVAEPKGVFSVSYFILVTKLLDSSLLNVYSHYRGIIIMMTECYLKCIFLFYIMLLNKHEKNYFTTYFIDLQVTCYFTKFIDFEKLDGFKGTPGLIGWALTQCSFTNSQDICSNMPSTWAERPECRNVANRWVAVGGCFVMGPALRLSLLGHMVSHGPQIHGPRYWAGDIFMKRFVVLCKYCYK